MDIARSDLCFYVYFFKRLVFGRWSVRIQELALCVPVTSVLLLSMLLGFVFHSRRRLMGWWQKAQLARVLVLLVSLLLDEGV